MKILDNIQVRTYDDYQAAAMRTCLGSSRNEDYMRAEVVSEAGEVVGKIAKVIRDGGDRRQDIIAELGDVMWGLAGYCEVKGLKLGDYMTEEILTEAKAPADVSFRSSLLDVALDLVRITYQFATDDIELSARDAVVHITTIAEWLGSSLSEVCQANIDKLTSRWNRNVINGSGDER